MSFTSSVVNPIFFNLSNKFDTCGYDTNISRINELKRKNDVNLEFQKKEFKFKKNSFFTNKEKDLKNSNFLRRLIFFL